jgi:hypothetical protein
MSLILPFDLIFLFVPIPPQRMDAIIRYNKPHCQIAYLSSLGAVQLKWSGFASSEAFREACDFSLKLLVEYQADRMIADNTHAKIVLPEDQEWMNRVWFPKAFKGGFRTSAVVVAQDVFRDLSVKKIVNDMDMEKFEVQFFSTPAAAYDWLAQISH